MSAAIPDLDITMGAIVVSSWFSFLTMGICCVAGWEYYRLFPNDPIVFKGLVSVSLLMCLVDTVADGYWCYDWTILHYGDPTIMGILPVALIVEIFCVGTIALVVQHFYAWRLYKISQESWYLPLAVSLCSFIQWGVVMWVVSFWSANRLITDVGRVLPVGYAWLVCAIMADILITGGMVYYLRIKHRGTGHASTVRSFNQIISRTVQSNALSLLSQVVTIALFKANVGMYFFLNDFTIVKVYTFSLLISLNARRGSTMLGSVTESRSGGMPMGNLAGPTGRNTTRLGNNLSGTNHVLAVQVRQEMNTYDENKDWVHHDANSSERDIDSKNTHIV